MKRLLAIAALCAVLSACDMPQVEDPNLACWVTVGNRRRGFTHQQLRLSQLPYRQRGQPLSLCLLRATLVAQCLPAHLPIQTAPTLTK